MNGPPSTSKDVADISNIIPPKLIRNYDVYIVLKAKENNNSEEQNLIDFDTDTGLTNISDTSSNIHVDHKRELSVIDLFEDITVNAQTLSLQKTSIDKVVFDPLELKNSSQETEKTSGNVDRFAALKDLDKFYNASPNLALNEQVDGENNLHDPKCLHDQEQLTIPELRTTNEIDEDLIEDLLTSHIRRLVVNNDKCGINCDKREPSADVANKVDTETFEIPKLKRFLDDDEIKKENNLGNLSQMNNAKSNTPRSFGIDKRNDLGAIAKISQKITLKSTNLSQLELPINIFNKPISNEKIKEHINHLLNSRNKYCNLLKYYNPKDFLYANDNRFIVETVKLDKKKYNKRRISVETTEAEKYTEGPTFEEKSRVLPQIMERLVKKKAHMEKYAQCKKKLILDSGCLKKGIPAKFDPVILTEDCNKDRLKNLLARQSFGRFVLSGHSGCTF